MLDLAELEQLVAFAELGTLSRAAEELHISTPSLTRSMRHIEQAFGVPLFTRSKNRIELNETGRMAVERARGLLHEAQDALRQVRAFDQRQHTVVMRSCAPAPLLQAQLELSRRQVGKAVNAQVCPTDEVLGSWRDGSSDVAIVPFQTEGAHAFLQEQLFVCVPENHELARHESLSFGQINGFNFLLRTELGFWDALCRSEMPTSKFLVQTDKAVFDELVAASSLPCFTSDYAPLREAHPGRVEIPLTDDDAHVTFYLLER